MIRVRGFSDTNIYNHYLGSITIKFYYSKGRVDINTISFEQ